MKQNQSLAPRWQWVATLDTRTCPICGGYDGKRWPVGEGPTYPAHENCRCDGVPITVSIRELLGKPAREDFDPLSGQLRESMDGLRPASTSWPEWMAEKESQSPGFAKEILGPSRYKAWKSGEFELTDFSRDGKIRTLASLGIEKVN